MITKTKTPATSPKLNKRLFQVMKKSHMTAIDRKIHALLIAEGYMVIETQHISGGGFNNDINVNRMEYLRGKRERAFITTHKQAKGARK